MGVVHRARDLATDRPVAVKLLRRQALEVAWRFAQEAAALSSLTHPGIVRHVAHGGTEDGRLWLAMEWLEGEDLSTRLRRGRLPPAEAVALLRGAADAMAEAHRLGFVHRDLKPANLFLVD